MKKYILVLLTALICASTINYASAKTTSNTSLASAIKMYKAGNYSQCYVVLNNIVKKDPSNAVAYYYLAMTASQIGKKDEAITNYEKVITLSPNSQVGLYAAKGKLCIESPDKCHEETATSDLDEFIKRRFGSGFTEEVRGDFEKQKIENLMREMNRKNDIPAERFQEYKDFSGAVPSNDEIVSALRVLQRAGFGELVGANNGINEMALFMGGHNSSNSVLNMLNGNNSSTLNPQVIQSLLTNQMTAGF